MRQATAIAATLLLGVLAFASQAPAIPLNGSFAMDGPFEWTDNTGASVALGTATSLDFRLIGAPNTATPGVAGSFSVTDSQGSFLALVPVGTVGSVRDISYRVAGNNASFPFPPVLVFETAGATPVTVDLLSITFVQTACAVGCDLTLANAFITIQGNTTIHAGSAFDANTPGTFTFQGNQTGASFAFAASNGTVPEPSALLLLGLGLSGLGLAGRLKRR